ncbi:MAG: peptidase inhibitor family I36 protein, partial [Photobacterium frigidiphilum]|uniref:peptidase inhibitor family I36 protein n=1 Tax=Photobacterium frigidiphilum TaxID=264736 RepID=UPI0030012F88
MKKTILIASVLLSGTAWAEDAKVCFYEDKNFLGQQWCTQQLGQQNIPSHMNDKVTSIRLYGNAYVKVYEHGNQRGKSTTVMQDTFLFKRLNDSISSFELLERTTNDFACLYQDSGYAGTPMCTM